MNYFLTCVAILFSCNVFTQSYNGKILDRETGKAIPYVNIGLLKKGDGFTSDLNGNYRFNPVFANATDTLMFSCIGYKVFFINAYDLLKDTSKIVYLDKLPLNNNSPKPLSGKFILKEYGHTSQSSLADLFILDVPAAEHGAIISFKKPAVLQTIVCNMAQLDTDSIYCRINIYKQTGNMQFENILEKPLYLIASKKDFNDRLILDVSGENIWVQGDYLFCIQNLFMENKSRKIALKGSLSGHTYSRYNSSDPWQKNGLAPAIWTEVKLPAE